jgi:hypothetical protein
VAAEGEVAQQVQDHGHYQGIGGVAMQAAQDPAGKPLAVRQGLHRRIRAGEAGLEERVDVQARRDDDPEQEVADGAEVVERIEPFAEDGVE